MLRKGILAAAAAAVITTAGATAALADFTILAWPGGPAEAALRKVVDQYNATVGKENNSKGSLIYFSRDSFFDKMLADAAAGSKEFDAMLTATYNIGKYAPFMDPIDDVATDEVKSTFPQSAFDTQSYQGHLYGIPTDLSLHFIYFRKDLMDQLLSDDGWKKKYAEIAKDKLGKDLQPKAPADWNWDDFVATALFFTKSINPDSPVPYGTVLQMKNLLFNIMVFEGAAASFGGNWLDKDGNVTVDSDAWRKALDVYKKIADEEATPGDSNSYEYAEANAAFGTGKVAFMLQWSAAYAELIDPKQYPAVEGKFDITHEPAGPEGVKTHAHTLGLGLNKASDKKDEVKRFLAYLGGNEAMTLYTKEGGQPPVVDSIMQKVASGRPDMLMMSDNAGKYGFVPNGGTSAEALGVYTNMAENFTGYWNDALDQDTAIKNVVTYMQGVFKK